MFYVLSVLIYRSFAASREEEEEVLVDVLYEVEDVPPSYPEEKAPLVAETQA